MATFGSNQAFQINDIFFTVGPNNIQVQKENLTYRWHGLRQDSSTKISTNHGGCVVSINIPIPREDILKLHRLIIQFKQNPFAFIENKYLREEIVPNWPSTQQMAFTLLSLNVESVPGNVGLFILHLEMQWFNYFPYTHNFTFREEWETDWIASEHFTEEDLINLPYNAYIKGLPEDSLVRAIRKSIYSYITAENGTIPHSLEQQMKSGSYIYNQDDSWQMFMFDLLPLPGGMRSSREVFNPRQSKIYVRYFNQLQVDSLYNNFGILIDAIEYLGYNEYYAGILSGDGSSTSHVTLPEYLAYKGVSSKVIEQMTKYDNFTIKFNVYKTVELLPSIKQSLVGSTSKMINSTIAFAEGSAIVSSYSAAGVNDYYNPKYITSPYGMRVHPILGRQKFHNGIDYAHPLGVPIPAIADGLVVSSFYQAEIKDGKTIGGGNIVVIKHDETSSDGQAIYSQYMHLHVPGALVNTRVKRGDTIGITGSSGGSTGPHLHLTILIGKDPIDPAAWFASQSSLASIKALNTAIQSAQTAAQQQAQATAPISTDDMDEVPADPAPLAPSTEQTQQAITENGGAIAGNPTTSLTEPWYNVFDTIKDQQLSEEDIDFIEHIFYLYQQGYKYYDKDPTINGVFFKQIEFTVPGHGPFNSLTNSHDTVLTRINGSLKHIVCALPIAGHEFPTHQHLGSTDAQYSFEFVTLDHEGNREGLGKGGQYLESIRVQLQQNGRNLKTIFDSWMADTDNFITRLFGTYDHFGPNKKKTIIASTQSATVEGNPGSSVIVLNCEETLSIVNENLNKVTSFKKKSYEEIYRKIISRVKEVIKFDNGLEKKYKNGIDKNPTFEEYGTPTGHGVNAFNLLQLTFKVTDALTLDAFDTNDSDSNFKSGFSFNLDTTSVSGLNQEELNRLTGFINQLNNLSVLGQLILIDEKFGQYGASVQDDLYGFESLLYKNGAHFIKQFLVDRNFIEIFLFLETTISQSLETVDNAYYNFLLAGAQNLLVSSTKDFNSEATWEHFNNLFAEISKNEEKIKNKEYVISPILKSFIVGSYLLYLNRFTGNFSIPFISGTMDLGINILSDYLPSNPDNSPLIKQEYFLGESVIYGLYNHIHKSQNSITKQEWENNKLQLITNSLIEILQYALSDNFLIKFFGLEQDLAEKHYSVIADQADALPDLKLPPHPFWNKTYLTPPDFYYYNLHEDGQFSSNNYELYKPLSDKYVANVYGFMSNWQSKGLRVNLSGSYSGGEVEDSERDFGLSMDGSLKETPANYPNDLAKDGLIPAVPGKYTKDNKLIFYQEDKVDNRALGLTSKSTALGSTFDKDALYAPTQTKDLIEKIKRAEFSFGKQEGYANEREEIGKVFNFNDKIGLSDQSTSFTHFYGSEDLKQIVQESKKDIISQKFTMKRAWPTFRLYFIEEDQSEDFLFRYDDFYHYNAIKSIVVTRSRKIAGDVAVITLQNISGILDGTKRAVIKDTDYLNENRTATGELTTTGKVIDEARSYSNIDTAGEEIFGSIVLRPGVNVQLRMGYGNDPNNLEVKLSGRVVDVIYSDNSDIAEITVQSFGSELEQIPKGLNPNESDTYILTHKLLGALMLSPELIHFGRWEVGVQPQFGEFKDSKLDFKRYNNTEPFVKLKNHLFSNSYKSINDTYKMFVAPTSEGGFGAYEFTLNPLTNFKKGVKTAGRGVDLAGSVIKDAFSAITGYDSWSWLTQKIKKKIEKKITRQTSYALNTPQDDNLYPPNPKDYIFGPNWVTPFFKQGFNSIIEGRFTKAMSTSAQILYRVFVSQKLTVADLMYVLNNTTIWQVFHEMTLRHPGYIYSPVPYGKEFRYTMFFGVPSQRYWSKPAHPLFIKDVNQLCKGLNTYLGGGNISKSNNNAVSNSENPKSFEKLKATLKELNTQKQLLQDLGYSDIRQALLDYYTSLTLRFEPFRRYHMATSDTDIISNDLHISEYETANAVAVKYFKSGIIDSSGKADPNVREQEGIKVIKIHDRIPDEEIRLTRIPDYPNVGSEILALRYGVGSLIYEAKNMYSGSLMLIGNSRIKPWDIVFVIDKYSDVCGPIEVEEITETLSFETGYVVDIKPNAVVFANEISSFPIMEGLKAFVAARSAEMDALTPNYNTNNSLFNTLATTGFSAIDLADLSSSVLNGRTPRELAAFAGEELTRQVGIPNDLSASNTIQNTFMSGAWLIGGWFYINKCLDNQSIIVYPLMKNGLPLIAGIPGAQPDTLWNITFGQIQSLVDDTTRGTMEMLARWKLLGYESIKAFTRDANLNKEIANSSNSLN